MALLLVPTHRTRLAQEKESPGGPPRPLPGIVLSPGQKSVVHSRAINFTGGTCLSGEAASPSRTGDLGGNHEEPSPTSTLEYWGPVGADGYRAPPESTLTPSHQAW